MHLYSDDETGVAQQRVLQLPHPQHGIAIAIAFIQHHLLGVVGPAFCVTAAEKQFSDLGMEVTDPQELYIVTRIHFVDRRSWNHAVVERLHPSFGAVRRPLRIGCSHVEKCLAAPGFIGARRVHRRRRRCPHKRRRIFQGRRRACRNGDDLFLGNERSQTLEGVTKRLHQMIGRRVILLYLGKHFLHRKLGIDFGGDFLHRLLITMQIRVSDFEQAIQRNIYHLVVKQFLAIVFCSNAKISARLRQH